MTEEPTLFDPDGPLSAVPAWWLEVRCGCGQLAQLPARLLVQRHGPRARAAELVARMRCARCRARPASADWIDNPQGSALGTGYPAKRRVPVPQAP